MIKAVGEWDMKGEKWPTFYIFQKEDQGQIVDPGMIGEADWELEERTPANAEEYLKNRSWKRSFFGYAYLILYVCNSLSWHAIILI